MTASLPQGENLIENRSLKKSNWEQTSTYQLQQGRATIIHVCANFGFYLQLSWTTTAPSPCINLSTEDRLKDHSPRIGTPILDRGSLKDSCLDQNFSIFQEKMSVNLNLDHYPRMRLFSLRCGSSQIICVGVILVQWPWVWRHDHEPFQTLTKCLTALYSGGKTICNLLGSRQPRQTLH